MKVKFKISLKKCINFYFSSNITPPYQKLDGELEVLRNNAAGKASGLELFMKFPSKEHHLPDDTFRLDGYSVSSKIKNHFSVSLIIE